MSLQDSQIAYTLGVWLRPGMATAYPDLVRMLNRIYQDKVAKLPWIPPSWWDAITQLGAKNPGALIQPTSAINARGTRNVDAPSWADSPEKEAAWQEIFDSVNRAVSAYGKKMSEEGANELSGLYAAAAFWDASYKLAKFAADLPSKIVSGVAGGLTDFVGSFLPEGLKSWAKWIMWAILLLIVGGLIMWYRGKLSAIVGRLKGGA